MIADLSHYQGTIDWSKAAPHLDFVILRASVGSNKDNKYNVGAHTVKESKIQYTTPSAAKENEKEIENQKTVKT